MVDKAILYAFVAGALLLALSHLGNAVRTQFEAIGGEMTVQHGSDRVIIIEKERKW